MSPIRYRGRHRKPSRASTLIRGGVLSGVVGTVAVTGAATPANAAEDPVETTAELRALNEILSTSGSQAARATETYADLSGLRQQHQRAEQRAFATAQQAAAEQRAEEEAAAEAAAEEARRAAEEAAAEREAEEAASRSAERSTLAAASAPAATESAPAPAPAPSGSAAAVVAFAQAQLGDAYVMGATGPDAWDCSSLVQAAYASAGVSLPRTSQPQSTSGTQVSLSNLQPGDILYWGSAGSAYHVAIYIGGGQFIGAQNSSTGVVQRDMAWDTPTGAVRIL
ncbi:C40 family peptidase [Streptomyces sp. XM4011]|uniref:C40 family peptidase n=1 Tax=Streptomyces TaxID=1883 RepID=UPI001FFAC7A5|nr:C40 family peptidase [Streptomyces sp. XM4011]MCK1812677.1 C40 family peptidase [Streptomyces sp. XM4011]